MTDNSRKNVEWMTVEIRGCLGHILYLQVEGDSAGPLRAKVKKRGMWDWEIYLESELSAGGRMTRGWMLFGREIFKDRAIEEARMLLLHSLERGDLPSRPTALNRRYPFARFRLFAKGGR
ncbi:hypothetical protein [Salinithrix halophila]|uniref:Uncharacterized protein n=1 Tax=Salinithrix halophila TaxID=1485204 RepID=A0ABV8JI74_9BACL